MPAKEYGMEFEERGSARELINDPVCNAPKNELLDNDAHRFAGPICDMQFYTDEPAVLSMKSMLLCADGKIACAPAVNDCAFLNSFVQKLYQEEILMT